MTIIASRDSKLMDVLFSPSDKRNSDSFAKGWCQWIISMQIEQFNSSTIRHYWIEWCLVTEFWERRAFGVGIPRWYEVMTLMYSAQYKLTAEEELLFSLYRLWFTGVCQNTQCQWWLNIDPLSDFQYTNWMCWYLVTTCVKSRYCTGTSSGGFGLPLSLCTKHGWTAKVCLQAVP